LLNPSSAKLVRNVSDWKYSSYKEFFEEDTIIDKEEILEKFSTNSSFKNFIEKENESFDYDYFRVWK